MEKDATEILYGSFPRAVGVTVQRGDDTDLRQFPVHSQSEFDVFLDRVSGNKDPYASISWEDWHGTHHLDKVSIDLDSPTKDTWEDVFGNDPPDDVKISMMREDSEVADRVLGSVLDDGRKIAERAREESIPVVGLFSGFGLHVHLLYQEETEDLQEKILTTARKWVRELNLETVDGQVSGDHQRILRVPNSERMAGPIDDPRSTGLFTIPLTRNELENVSADELLERSRSPREDTAFEVPPHDERPEMKIHEDFRDSTGDYDVPDEQRDVDASVIDDGNGLLKFFLREWLRMPCMYERITQPKPDRFVRFNCSVLLFNVGFSPLEVANIYKRIGWVDYDRDITLKQLQHIYRSGYADASCEKIRREGYCVLDQQDWVRCPCYGWSGGAAEWK